MGIDPDKIQIDWELAEAYQHLPESKAHVESLNEEYTGWNRWFTEAGGSIFHLGRECPALASTPLWQPLYAGLTVEEVQPWHPVCPLCTSTPV